MKRKAVFQMTYELFGSVFAVFHSGEGLQKYQHVVVIGRKRAH